VDFYLKLLSKLQRYVGWRLSLKLGAIPLVLLVCVILIALDGYHIWGLRVRDIAEARQETANLALSLGQQAEDTMRTADLTLIGSVQRLEIDGTGPDTLEKLRQIMMARLAAFPALASFVVTDAAGKCLIIDLPAIPDNCSLAGAADYEYHRTHEDLGPHLGAPERAIGSAIWVIPWSRRFNRPDGGFAGMAVTGISVPYFTHYYSTFDIGQNGSIALALADGTLLVRRPYIDLGDLRTLEGGFSRDPIPESSIGAAGKKSSIDGVVRLTSYRRLEAYPLVVAVGESMDDILASWRSTLWYRVAGTVGLVALVGFMGVRLTTQIRERERAEQAKAAELARFQFIFDAASDGINVMDSETGMFTDVNAASCTMFGYSRDELIGRTIEFLSTGISPYTQSEAIASLAKGKSGEPQTIEWHCKAKNGHLFWAEISFRNVALGNRSVGLAILRDITARKRRHDEVVRQANIDALTELPNRRAFDDVFQQEVARIGRYDRPLCVAIGDIDHFKTINDTFGHQIGDFVLRKLAEFMRKSLRTTDYVARWGGEEFTILLPETQLDVAERLLNRLRTDIANYVIPEIGQSVTLSFGVTACTKSDDADALLQRADRALYTSKQTGRNQVTKLRRSAAEAHSTPALL
jgi:diguanylate cyclase (GGDEF)-like protein/PAS domain S-box-containing protein